MILYNNKCTNRVRMFESPTMFDFSKNINELKFVPRKVDIISSKRTIKKTYFKINC